VIDPAVFDRMMTAMSDRIGKSLGSDAGAMYYATLSQELTTEEFQRGMAGIFRDHGFNTWPAPAEIIDRAKPSRKLEATAAWTELEEHLQRDEYSRTIAQLRQRVSETTLATFLSLGGVGRWLAGDAFRRAEMRREFLANYGDMARLEPAQQVALSGSHERQRLTGKPEPIARLLPGVAPYSPGDPDRD
jgi:hypothetical protein